MNFLKQPLLLSASLLVLMQGTWAMEEESEASRSYVKVGFYNKSENLVRKVSVLLKDKDGNQHEFVAGVEIPSGGKIVVPYYQQSKFAAISATAKVAVDDKEVILPEIISEEPLRTPNFVFRANPNDHEGFGSLAIAAANPTKIKLTTLKCNETEDWGEDECKLDFWADSNHTSDVKYHINSGSKWDLNKTFYIRNKLVVRLTELDTETPIDKNDILGEVTIRPGAHEDGSYVFDNFTANYVLRWIRN